MNLFKAKSLSGPVLITVAGVLRKLYSVQNAIPLHDPELRKIFHNENENKMMRISIESKFKHLNKLI